MTQRPPYLAIAILASFAIMALFGPHIVPFDPMRGALGAQFLPPMGHDSDGALHVLGTDQYGRDLLSRLIWGARVSIVVALVSILVAGTIGTLVGMVAGYHGGRVDAFLMRLADITLSLPLFLIAIVMSIVFGPTPMNVIIAVALLLWPRYARQVRGETLALVRLEFVDYARALKIDTARILGRHVLPNLVPTLIVLSTWQAGYVVILESSLSFLGAGVPPPNPAWGLMVAEGNRYLTTSWWLALAPGLAIVALVLSANLLGDWLRDRLDPMLASV